MISKIKSRTLLISHHIFATSHCIKPSPTRPALNQTHHHVLPLHQILRLSGRRQIHHAALLHRLSLVSAKAGRSLRLTILPLPTIHRVSTQAATLRATMRTVPISGESLRHVPTRHFDYHAITFRAERAVLAHVPSLVGRGRRGGFCDG